MEVTLALDRIQNSRSATSPYLTHIQIAMANHWTMDVVRLPMCVIPGMVTAPLMTSVPPGQDVAPTIVLWSTLMLFLVLTVVLLSVKQEIR